MSADLSTCNPDTVKLIAPKCEESDISEEGISPRNKIDLAVGDMLLHINFEDQDNVSASQNDEENQIYQEVS